MVWKEEEADITDTPLELVIKYGELLTVDTEELLNVEEDVAAELVEE